MLYYLDVDSNEKMAVMHHTLTHAPSNNRTSHASRALAHITCNLIWTRIQEGIEVSRHQGKDIQSINQASSLGRFPISQDQSQGLEPEFGRDKMSSLWWNIVTLVNKILYSQLIEHISIINYFNSSSLILHYLHLLFVLVSLPFFYEFSSFIIRVVRCTDHEVGRMDTISSFTIWWNLKTNDGWVCSCYQRHQRGYKTTSAKKPHNLLRYRHVSLPSYKSINEAQIEFHPHLSTWANPFVTLVTLHSTSDIFLETLLGISKHFRYLCAIGNLNGFINYGIERHNC